MQSGSKPTAVVIDDSRTIRVTLKQALTQAGFDVVAEGDTGTQAAQLYERHKPTLITLDIVLPELDGVSAAIDILKRFPRANVVMCSSLTARDKILACKDAGVSHFILKPFTPERICQVAQSVLKMSAPQTSGVAL